MAVAAEQRHPSPLRYPGGKGKIANYAKLVILDNNLVGCEYVEPYAGGASIALSLLFEEYADHVHINDINRGVSAFWDAVTTDPDPLCRRIADVRLTVEEWKRQRSIQRDPNSQDGDLAFSTFFLNRTSRSGVIRGGGVIGGLDQSGPWKMDARFNRDQLIRRIQRIARFSSRITVTRKDAADFLRNDVPQIDNAFAYLDPPYYVKGAKGARLYENFYTDEDHREIAQVVRQLSVPWVVSYDADPAISMLYRGFNGIGYDLTYSAAAANPRGAELMFFSPGLRVPCVESPAGIDADVVAAARVASASR